METKFSVLSVLGPYNEELPGLRPKSDYSGKAQMQFTVIYRPVQSSERALQNYKPATVKKKFQGESKIGHRSQMGA
jgi:hypothetical protein